MTPLKLPVEVLPVEIQPVAKSISGGGLVGLDSASKDSAGCEKGIVVSQEAVGDWVCGKCFTEESRGSSRLELKRRRTSSESLPRVYLSGSCSRSHKPYLWVIRQRSV